MLVQNLIIFIERLTFFFSFILLEDVLQDCHDFPLSNIDIDFFLDFPGKEGQLS